METIKLGAPVADEDLDPILSFIPRLETIIPDKVVIESPGRLLDKHGDTLVLAMHGQYHPLVQEFLDALYRHGFVRSFDWGKWSPQAKAIVDNPKRLERASMLTCVKLLTLHARTDRFVEGHFAAMLSAHHISAILRRMETLKDQVQQEAGPEGGTSQLIFKHHIYRSKPSKTERYAPRFGNPYWIQDRLKRICEAWAGYLQNYTDRTAELFGNAECPWESTERGIVSTLSAAITRSFPGSIVHEESRVLKPGQEAVKTAKKKSNLGRCDLWASIPDLTPRLPPFNFYLEAKKSLRPKDSAGLEKHLTGKYGISKIFRDYMVSNPRSLSQRSAFRHDEKRKHEHFTIGLLVTPLRPGEGEMKATQKFLAAFSRGWISFLFAPAKLEPACMTTVGIWLGIRRSR